MRFKDIKILLGGVELTRAEKQPNGSLLKQDLTDPSRPLPSFNAAMQAFSGFVVDLVGVSEWHDQVHITSVHLSEQPKTNRRGLVVTFSKKIDRAKGNSITVNTPVMWEPTDDADGTLPGTFPKEVFEMIEILEAEATRYWKGEREQTEMFEGQATEAKGKKSRKEKDAPSNVAPADDNLRKLLLDAGRDVPIDVLVTLGSSDRERCQAWAVAQLRVKSGDLRADAAPKEPKVLLRYATPALIEA